MNKILFFIYLLVITFNSTYACNVPDLGKKLPVDFSSDCYSQAGALETNAYLVNIGEVEQCMPRNTFIVKTQSKIDTFVSGFDIIPNKLYKSAGDSIDYTFSIDGNTAYLQDNNYKTTLEFDTDKTTSLNLTFDKVVKSGTSKGIFLYKSKNYYTEYLISEDGIKYSKVNISYNGSNLDLGDFDFKYLKINFLPNNKSEILREKIIISELNIVSTGYEYLIKARGNIMAYSNNICKNKYFNLSNDTGDYNLDKNTNVLDLILSDNENFDVLTDKDYDHDGITDSVDNCGTVANPLQKDKNGDGKGDMCTDDDKDGILGHKDNCIDIYNPIQKDINMNGVGDICEFDKDKDGIFDSIDNCINIENKYQEDDDRDGIGNACDNCKGYNPKQLDLNNNQIGDICEREDADLKAHDKDGDLVRDSFDNCIDISNINQFDTDKDGVGNLCDNCLNMQNSNQLDFDENGVGDMCEDSDKDGIQGITDNCINTPNADQQDTDNNGVGDACEDSDRDNIEAIYDNCPYRNNPNQSDIDEDGIGDKCDDEDNRFFESNKDLFIGLMIFVVGIFGVGIATMARKISGNKEEDNNIFKN